MNSFKFLYLSVDNILKYCPTCSNLKLEFLSSFTTSCFDLLFKINENEKYENHIYHEDEK